MAGATPGQAGAECTPPTAAADAPVALVFSGGGAKGAYEAGVALGLLTRGVPIRLVAGSSAGALNAAMVADGRVDKLDELWRGVTREQVYAFRPSILFAGLLPGWLTLLTLDRAGSLFDATPLRALIERALDFDRVRASGVRLVVVTTDLERREKRLFDNRTVTVDALMAAAAVPGAFPPVEIDGALLVDGGLTARAPVLEALEAGVPVGRVIVVMSYASGERGERATTMRRVLEEAFEMAMIHQIRRDTELARLRYPHVDVALLTPSAPLALRPLDFAPAALAAALELGRADAASCLAPRR
ncbi:MAG TPA: patatin-like phospholipase family protein [Solirubrobacteraceae bacterium]